MKRSIHRYISMVLSLIILFSTIALTPTRVFADPYFPGEGTEANPFLITTAEQSTLASAEEKTAAFVTRFYQLCLSRDPDATGLSNWVNELQSGRQTGADVAYGFVFSPEFQNRNVSNTEYVTIMYKAFFNRDPDAGGFKNWMDALSEGMSRYYVLAGFTNSQEFIDLANSFGINPGSLTFTDPADLYPDITKFVTRFYQQFLSRMPDSEGLNSWVRNLQTREQTGTEISYGFVYSREFQDRNVSDAEYVTIMYKAFFNRDPDTDGYNNWMSILKESGKRYDVLAGFANSQEFTDLCQAYGITRGTLNNYQTFTAVFYVKSGRTATGTTTTAGRTIAVDPKVIPYGTKVYIEGWGYRTAEDCGNFSGNIIDIFVNSLSDIPSAGRITVQLRIVG